MIHTFFILVLGDSAGPAVGRFLGVLGFGVASASDEHAPEDDVLWGVESRRLIKAHVTVLLCKSCMLQQNK